MNSRYSRSISLSRMEIAVSNNVLTEETPCLYSCSILFKACEIERAFFLSASDKYIFLELIASLFLLQ